MRGSSRLRFAAKGRLLKQGIRGYVGRREEDGVTACLESVAESASCVALGNAGQAEGEHGVCAIEEVAGGAIAKLLH